MSLSRSLVLLCCATAVLGRAQTAPPAADPSGSSAASDHVEHLDALIVSAGPDPRTAFDLAQGTSVLAGNDLRKIAQSTLGETLSGTPGVSSTYYGPGASRPVIRGLGGDRIRVLDNGVGALDASAVSPDHNTAIEPLFASRIEVLRGPSTLLYGSSAVGGAVNVIDTTIPDTPAIGVAHGTVELRAGGAARERAGVLSAGGGAGDFAMHVNALTQRSDDLRIPGVPRMDAAAPADQISGVLPDSAARTSSIAGGASRFWSSGHAGAGVTHYETIYGVPTDEPGVSIRMRQTRLDLAGETTAPFAVFRSAKARLGYGDYRHSELADATIARTTFTNQAWEGRLELPHIALGDITGTWGLQGSRSDFSAVGDEVATPPTVTQSGAFFALEELKLGERATLQAGARLEGQSIALGEVDPRRPVLPGADARSGQRKRFGATSASAGIVVHPATDWSVAATLASTTRLPTAQELFSNGPHGGTGAYEIGTSALRNERSLGFDLSVRRRAGFLTGSAGIFVNRFRNYIFEERLPADAIPPAFNPDGLTPYRFVSRDVEFRGAEAEISLHFLDGEARHLHLDLSSDYVRAEETGDGHPLPRIPPLRYGAKLDYDGGRWRADLGVRHAASQERVAPGETPTRSYTLLDANLAYEIPTKRVGYEIFLRGRNLTNETAREHTSFLKEFAPLPGRGVTVGVRAAF